MAAEEGEGVGSEACYTHKKFIIKADDWGRGRSRVVWDRFINACSSSFCRPSIGVVTGDLAKNAEDYIDLLRFRSRSGDVEIFDHSYTHRNFCDLSDEEIVNEISSSQQIFEKEFGIQSEIFGAPFNKIDARSAGVIHSVHPYKFYYEIPKGGNYVGAPLNSMVRLELSTQTPRPVSLPLFYKSLEEKSSPSLIILQVHPDYWSDDCFTNFEEILQHLVGRGYVNVTATDFVSYGEAIGSKDLFDLSNLSHLICFDEKMTDGLQRAAQSTDRDAQYLQFYHGRYRNGSHRLRAQLQKIGFDTDFGVSLRPNDKIKCLDVGCGSGNWVAAYNSLSPRHQATGLDRSADLVNTIKQESQRIIAGGLDVVAGSSHAPPFPAEHFSHFLCMNALSYMHAETTLREVRRVVKSGGYGFVGFQNDAFVALEVLRALRSGDHAQAVRRTQQYVHCELLRIGLAKVLPFWRTWSEAEFAEIANSCGYWLILREVDSLEPYGFLGAKAVYSYYLMVASAQALALSEAENSLPTDRLHLKFSAGAYRSFAKSCISAESVDAKTVFLMTSAQSREHLNDGGFDRVVSDSSIKSEINRLRQSVEEGETPTQLLDVLPEGSNAATLSLIEAFRAEANLKQVDAIDPNEVSRIGQFISLDMAIRAKDTRSCRAYLSAIYQSFYGDQTKSIAGVARPYVTEASIAPLPSDLKSAIANQWFEESLFSIVL